MRAWIGEIEIDFAANEIIHDNMFARGSKSQRALVFEDVAAVLKFFQIAFVNFSALTLKVRTDISADMRAFVPIDAQPFETLVNRGCRFLGIAFDVGVFDSQN